MGKGKKKHPGVNRIVPGPQQSRAFLDRVKKRRLVEEDYNIIEAMTETIQFITEALEEKNISIRRLQRYLFGAPTESAKNITEKAESGTADEGSASAPKERKRSKGHGRNGWTYRRTLACQG